MAGLKFGTAGLRGIMQAGDGYMNVDAIREATAGLAVYLWEKKGTAGNAGNAGNTGNAPDAAWGTGNTGNAPDAAWDTGNTGNAPDAASNTGNAGKNRQNSPLVVVSYDTRNNSRLFAEETVEVLADYGINASLFEECMPVPVLSFAVRNLKADAGVMITASHNSKEYNGYKVYSSTGGQMLEDDAHEVEARIEKIRAMSDGERLNHKLAVSGRNSAEERGTIMPVPEKVYREYLEAVVQVMKGLPEAPAINLIYTPLNGSGRKPASEAFQQMGIPFKYVEEQWMPDGNFPTTPQPNPEKPSVFELACSLAEKSSGGQEGPADLIIANDPDADRMGAMVYDNGGYNLLNGNEIGTILAYFLCSVTSGGRADTIVSTVVSTPLIDKIAEAYGCRVVRTLVGFKYIGAKMDELGDRFLFGFEESNGYLSGGYARDKDGIIGALLLIRAAAYYKEKGQTLSGVLDEIYEKFGQTVNETVSIEVASEEQRNAIMAALRSEGGYLDYLPGINGLPAADMLEKHMQEGARVIVRPSGTEPKIKIYITAGTEQQVAELSDFYKNAAESLGN